MRRLLLLALLLAACRATEPLDDDDTTTLDDDDAGDDDSTDDDDVGDDDSGDDDDITVPPGPIPVDPPPAPTYSDTVGTVSVTLVTADAPFAGTDSNALSLCLTETDCFTLNIADVNDQERGATDVYHVEGAALPRASIDRVELRSANGSDRYEPSCLAVQLDGEPVYCSLLSGLYFGEEGDELASWIDPQGLHLGCTTCDPAVLTHGPMLGAPRVDGARVWARTDATRLVGLEVGSASDLADAVTVDWAWPSPLDDYAAHLSATNLPAGSDWWGAVTVDGVRQGAPFPIAVPESAGPLTFAFGSCSKDESQPVFATIDALDPDLFVFVGDNHYGNTDVVDALRWNYRWSLERPERAALLRATPTLATWDDHDYVGNNTDATAPGRANALRVFQEYWANPGAGAEGVPGVFTTATVGAVEFFLLDDRYHRGLDASVLGGPQQQWLLDRLAASDATFKFLVSGSQWTADGSNDSWAPYVAQRDVILDFVRDQGISGVVLLSGDVHRSEFRVIERASAGGYDLPELTSSPLANNNSPCPDEDEILDCVDDRDLFVAVTVDPTALDPTLVATMHDVSGATLATYATTLSALTVP